MPPYLGQTSFDLAYYAAIFAFISFLTFIELAHYLATLLRIRVWCVLYFWCSWMCVVCCACFTKDPRYFLHRVVSFFGEIIVFIYLPLRECVPRSHFSRFLWERITRWNSFWNGLVPSHLGTRLPTSLSACLLYLFLISISKRKKQKNKKYNNY